MAALDTNNYIAFFHNILTTPAGSLPKGALWIAAFDDLNNRIVNRGIKTALQYEQKPWAIDQAAAVIASDAYQKNSGCIFCQAIDLPGEGTAVVPEGNINANAFLRSYVGAGRNQFPELRMTFLDTNVSFVDNICRPWAIATATFGLMARPADSEKNYRTNLYCWKLAAHSADRPPTITLSMTFYDICCVNVNNEEYNYRPSTSPVEREARFVYHYYSVNTQSDSKFLSNVIAAVDDPAKNLLTNTSAQDIMEATRKSEEAQSA
jgi:hypothetical protein